MKKIFTLTTIVLLSTLGVVNAQLLPDPVIKKDKTVIRCYTYQAMQEARAKNPGAETDEQFEAWMKAKLVQRRAARTALVNYTLPVVFHIISAGEAVGTTPNIDAKFAKAQIIMLNQAYSNQAGSPYAVSANTGLTFTLAEKNPSGVTLTEPGVDRINRVTKGWTDYGTDGWDKTYVDGTVKPNSVWDAAKYINVWVMPGLYTGTTDNQLVGYATFPATSGLSGLNNTETNSTAGVAIVTYSIGSSYTKSSCDPTNPYTTGKSLVHELGHFFGLRHIWGDGATVGACATDYCDDTPTSDAANYGIYFHPKSNICGTPDEMFEDYMDYTDDVLLNTFTQNQVDRIQTVMAASPRRGSLATSTAGYVPVVGSNNVAFIDYCIDSLNITEAGIKTSANQWYRDINVNISTEDKATGAGTVSFTTSGTAINGVDYQILTPTFNYAAGEAVKSTTLRIFDNAAIDGNRKIILGLNVGGTGVTAGTEHQTFTINILDDDNVKIGQNQINLLNENFETVGANGLPAGWRSLKSTGGLNSFVVSANGNATNGTSTGMCAHVTNNTTTKPNVYTRGTSAIALLQSPEIDPTTVQSVGNLSFKYRIRGRGTAANPVDYCLTLYSYGQTTGPFYYWNSTASVTGAGPYCTNSTTPIANVPSLATPAAIAGTKFAVNYYFVTGTATNGGDPGFNIDDITLAATPFPIETTVSNTYSFRVPAFVNNNFRSLNKRQILAISNSSVDMNGVAASITEAGNDQVAITTEAGSFMRSRKIATITAAAASAATYTGTLYFTQAEINAWGTDKLSVQVMQLNDGVDIFGMLNTSNAKLMTPTVTDNLATDGFIAYTFTTTGTGQFVIVSPATALPLKLVNFSGVLKNNISSLKWNTANEVNTNGFDVERSTDGNVYSKIGFVKSLNTVNNEYTFADEKITKGNKYLYRLKMIDIDGKFTYSNVVTINYLDKDKWFTVYPSPVKDMLFIQNNTAATQNADIAITEMSGKVVYKHTGAVNGKLEIPVSKWSAGTYVVKIRTNEAESTMKVVKQ